MHTPLKIAVFTATTLLPSAVIAEDTNGFYLKAYAGLSSLQTDAITLGAAPANASFDSGTAFGGAVGYDYANSPFRAELEFTYRSGDATLPVAVGTGGDFASTTLMLNGYYMFDTASKLTPYLGLGIGYATEIDFDIDGGGSAGEYSDRGSIAYQAMLGVEYEVSNRVSLFAETRYFSAGSNDLAGPGGTVLRADYDSLDINAGVVFRF
ncbi:MAG: outer membrane protein [Sedimentitalea sp.]